MRRVKMYASEGVMFLRGCTEHCAIRCQLRSEKRSCAFGAVKISLAMTPSTRCRRWCGEGW